MHFVTHRSRQYNVCVVFCDILHEGLMHEEQLQADATARQGEAHEGPLLIVHEAIQSIDQSRLRRVAQRVVQRNR